MGNFYFQRYIDLLFYPMLFSSIQNKAFGLSLFRSPQAHAH